MSQAQWIECEIQALGGLGDGIAEYEGKTLHIPYTVPGDIVKFDLHDPGNSLDILRKSKDRIDPACKHFGECGGCQLQHLKTEHYRQFKQNILEKIIQSLGCDSEVVQPLIELGAQSRRRVEFKLQHHKKQTKLGFFRNRSHEVVAVNHCPVITPLLERTIAPLKEWLAQSKNARSISAIHLTELASGIDAVIHLRKSLTSSDRMAWKEFAQQQAWIRLIEKSDNHQTLYKSGETLIKFGAVTIELPADSFLQATLAGEKAITDQVLRFMEGCDHIADLYSGCGTYSFPLLQQAQHISAFEGSHEMVAAMHNAILKADMESRITATSRDLYRHPLKTHELKPYDGIVINPPRNGALPQTKELAYCTAKTITTVSCNPATFKRDAGFLLEHGWKVEEVVAIDQFYWSNHLEIVAKFIKS